MKKINIPKPAKKPQLVLCMGLQATGKSSFTKQYFADTHIRLNRDMLKTAHREQLLFEACLRAKQSVVIDNTNPTKKVRQGYIEQATAAGFSVLGCYFQSILRDALERNANRKGKQRIPEKGLFATAKKFELPQKEEGFDALFYVSICPETKEFHIQEWKEENE